MIIPSIANVDFDSDKWPRLAQVDMLGHLISADTSPWPCFRRTERQLWAAFWKNCVGKKAAGLSVHERCRLMNRAVKPVLFFRNTRWAWTATLAQEQDRIQRRMLAQFTNLERLPLQTPAQYNRLHMRTVSDLAREQGA